MLDRYRLLPCEAQASKAEIGTGSLPPARVGLPLSMTTSPSQMERRRGAALALAISSQPLGRDSRLGAGAREGVCAGGLALLVFAYSHGGPTAALVMVLIQLGRRCRAGRP